MKKIAIFLFGLSTILSSPIWSDSIMRHDSGKLEEKLYVSLDHIQFHKNEIFVFYQNTWHLVNAIFSDANGLFITKQPSPELWYCKDCRRYHAEYEKCPYGNTP